MTNKNRIPQKRDNKTKASELRSQSVIATNTLKNMERNLDEIKLNKALGTDKSFSEIEKEKMKL
jgi:hypothetical protein